MATQRPPFRVGHKIKWRSEIEAITYLKMRDEGLTDDELLALERKIFTVLEIRPRKWDVKCVCAAKFCGGPSEHGLNCDVHYYPYEGYEVVVEIDGKRHTFPANLFEIAK